MNPGSPAPVRVYVFTWVALVILLAATFASAHWRLGALNGAINFGIAAAKAVLVALFFMHLRRASVVILVFAVAALFALGLLFGLSGTDYATREISVAPWEAP